MHFQVGIWTHAYNFDDSPNADRKITGLNPQNHAQYCRDALRTLLEACPTIGGLTLAHPRRKRRSGRELSVLENRLRRCNRVKRPVELDLHAKGLDWPMVELTEATGMPVTISPKYWAEHMGLPYHQAAIRQLEMPKERAKGDFFALSSGSRSFLALRLRRSAQGKANLQSAASHVARYAAAASLGRSINGRGL